MNFDLDDMLPVLNIEDLDQANENSEPQNLEEPVNNEPLETPEVPETLETPETSNDEKSDNQISTVIYNELAEKGIVNLEEGKEEYTWDEINNGLKYYSEDLPVRVMNSIIEAVPDTGKNLINYILSKQENLNSDDLRDYFKQHLDVISLPDSFNDDEEAKLFLRQEYKDKFRTSQIEAMIDALEDEDALKEEANKLIAERKQRESQKAEEIRNKSYNEQKQFVQSLSNEFNALPWKQDRVQMVKDTIVSGNANDLLSKILKSPNGLIHMIDFAHYYNVDNDSFDLSAYVNTFNSKQAKSLKDKITEDMLSSVDNATKAVKRDINKKGFDLSKYTPSI